MVVDDEQKRRLSRRRDERVFREKPDRMTALIIWVWTVETMHHE